MWKYHLSEIRRKKFEMSRKYREQMSCVTEDVRPGFNQSTGLGLCVAQSSGWSRAETWECKQFLMRKYFWNLGWDFHTLLLVSISACRSTFWSKSTYIQSDLSSVSCLSPVSMQTSVLRTWPCCTDTAANSTRSWRWVSAAADSLSRNVQNATGQVQRCASFRPSYTYKETPQCKPTSVGLTGCRSVAVWYH